MLFSTFQRKMHFAPKNVHIFSIIIEGACYRIGLVGGFSDKLTNLRFLEGKFYFRKLNFRNFRI